jgi:hypothetical protein
MEETDEFAPEYTTAERIRMALLGISASALLVLVGKAWVSPWYKSFVESAHCHYVFGYSGIDILFYSICVGVPTVLILGSSSIVFQGFKILRDNQAPPRGMKVLRKIRIVRGSKAKVQGVALAFVLPILLFSFVIWGYIQADGLIKTIDKKKFDYAACKTNSTLHTDAVQRR